MYDRRRLAERLQRALIQRRWSEVRSVAELLGGYRPEDRQAAWRQWLLPLSGAKDPNMIWPTPMQRAAQNNRFLMWIDAVGGFLVCLADEIVLGQAADDHGPDVPILGDLSRRHAVIRRDQEGYVVEPLRPMTIDGRLVETPTTLADGRVIELGNGVRLRFRRPHPLSATARLEFVSHHRTQPACDGVLLMADSCIVGPSSQSHVIARDLAAEVVLFRQGGGLGCRAAGVVRIDGAEHQRRGPLTVNSRVEGDDFSFTLEAV
jgi:FHA domain-containing protein